MSKCLKCNVYIADETDICPLCNQVLQEDDKKEANMYPDLRGTSRKFRLLENIILFLSIVAAGIVVTVDYAVGGEINWSIVVILILIYGNVVLRHAIMGKSGYIFKTISMVVFTIVLLIVIDALTGYKGWALNYVYPSLILLMDLGIAVLMIANHRNWQSYMLSQILTSLLGLLAVIFVITGLVTYPYLAYISLAASVLLFLGTLIIGDQRARTELKRRFYV